MSVELKTEGAGVLQVDVPIFNRSVIAVYGCDHRDPPHEASAALHMDAFDDRRLREEAHKTKIPLFGMAGEDVTEEARQSHD